jgi:hypothetical protein
LINACEDVTLVDETVGAAIHGHDSFIWLIAVHRCLQALT